MDRCIYCGAETQLYDNGRPICLKCAADLEKGRKPATSQRRTEGSSSELDRSLKDIASGQR